MSVEISNTPYELSGIVLYPETGYVRDVNDAQARQFGMVTNAHVVEGGDVHVGTVHAVGYDPQIAVDLQALHTPDGFFATDLNESARAQERILLDEMGRAVKGALDQRGLATEGLAKAMYRRRVDVILPNEVPSDRTIALENSLKGLVGDGIRDNIFPRLWAANDQGIETVSQGRSLESDHPLHPRRLGIDAQLPRQHRILTSGILLRASVQERATYLVPHEGTRLVSTTRGFQVTSFKQRQEEYSASYDIPIGINNAVVAQLDQLDARNEWRKQAYEDNIQGPNVDLDVIDLDLGSVHDGYRDDTVQERRALARLVDPADDPAWVQHLN